MRTKSRLVSAMLAVALVVSACGGSDGEDAQANGNGNGETSSSDPYLIGFSNGAAGIIGPLVTSAYAGLQTAFHEANEAGGIEGREIVAELVDDELDPGQTQVNLERFDERGAMFVLCCSLEAAATQAAIRADESSLPTATWTSTDAAADNPYAYNYFADQGAQQGEMSANFALELMAAEGITEPRVASISMEGGLEPPHTEALDRILEASSGEHVENEIIPITASDAEGQVRSVLAEDPDVVIMQVGGLSATVLNALRSRGFDGPVINYIAGALTTQFEQYADENYYAMRTARSPDETDIPEVQEALDAADDAGESGNIQSHDFTFGYIWGKLIVAALEECGNDCSREEFNDALRAVGPTLDVGELTFGPLTISEDSSCLFSTGQFFHWDADAGEPVPAGDPVEAPCPS